MGRSFDTENRRLTRHATAGDTEWGDAPPGLACDFARPEPDASSIPPPRKPHKRLPGLRMNRTTFEIEIALLRSSPALWSIEF